MHQLVLLLWHFGSTISRCTWYDLFCCQVCLVCFIYALHIVQRAVLVYWCLSVCLFVTLRYHCHIGWVTSKVIIQLITPRVFILVGNLVQVAHIQLLNFLWQSSLSVPRPICSADYNFYVATCGHVHPNQNSFHSYLVSG